MSELDAVKSRWDLLRAVHPLFVFADTLPSVDGADEGRYGRVANVEGLKNEITTLRSDIKLNMIHQRQFDIDELRDEDVEELDEELYCLLEMFDGLVDDAVLDQQDDAKAKDDAVADFPRLNALRAGLRSYERDVPSDTRTDRLGLSNKISEGQMAQNSGLIHHPQDPDSIGRCKRVVARFGAVLRLFEETASSWSMEAQTQYYTDAEVQIIEEAHAFGEACTTLFNALAGSIPEGSPHRQVELHLSGFRRQGLGIRGGCQHGRWISATYHALPHTGMSAGGFNGLCACACANAPEGEQPSLRVAFNSSDVWDPEDHYEDLWSPIKLTPSLLDNLMRQRRTLKPMHRKLLGVFLACSLLQLYNSPWIQEQWERQTIHLPTLPKDMKQLAHWYPQVLCRLSPEAAKKLDSDDMAAFGVLLMELEADDLAPWTEDDVEWPSDEKSNRSRLARILREWEEDVGDEYRQVAKNCLDFQMLADSFEHSHLGPELGHLAILYKCVLDPLFRCLVKDFGKTAQLFQGIPGPWGGLSGAVNVSSSDIAKQSLFDDIETTESDERAQYATRFLKELSPFFIRIAQLGMKKPGVAALRASPPAHDKIRIAVLDSGIDKNDTRIKGALKSLRIKKQMSFVGEADDWQDIYGHGTHVTRLLLQAAPAAEIFVGKICHAKSINQEFMAGIAKAIDWAVDECDAHIISLSFGSEDECEAIDAAVDRAVQLGKLVFAAASNSGGVKGRARPARNEDVMCIHASDGLGNKGDMNPSPLADTSNFSTLGVAVPLRWKDKDVWKSGTSFATPIAAGFAACVLEFANHRCSLSPARRKMLAKRRGMQAVFRRMAEKRDEYDFVHPLRLWKSGASDQEVAREVEDIIRGL